MYLLGTLAVFGTVPHDKLLTSGAPFTDAVNAMFGGTWGGAAVACAALVSIVGALNGWTLLSAQTAYAAARGCPGLRMDVGPQGSRLTPRRGRSADRPGGVRRIGMHVLDVPAGRQAQSCTAACGKRDGRGVRPADARCPAQRTDAAGGRSRRAP